MTQNKLRLSVVIATAMTADEAVRHVIALLNSDGYGDAAAVDSGLCPAISRDGDWCGRAANHEGSPHLGGGLHGIPQPFDEDSEVSVKTVACAMVEHGGGFVSSLGEALLRADGTNAERIRRAFPDYWKKYSELIAKAKEL